MTHRRITNGLPSLLFLGQAFRAPFSDALETLFQSIAPAIDSQELLGEIDNYARERSVRCVIAIDAINEGIRDSWTQALPAFSKIIRSYKGIALAVSCRTPFEKLIFPTAEKHGFQTVFHAGYPADQQDTAIEKYFTGYGIPLPEVPLLEEEFSNPLFLKLFCEAIEKVTVKQQHAQIKSITAGQRGMTHILEYVVREKDRDISKRLGTPPNFSWRFLKNVFAAQLASQHSDSMSLKDAVALANKAQPTTLPPGTLLQALVEEDILAEDVNFSGTAPPVEVIRFTYQKFSDHLIARHLLSSQLDARSKTTIKQSLSDPSRLGYFFRDEDTALKYANIVQALMIEFPTRIKNNGEVLDFLGWKGIPLRLCEALIEGLYWREPSSINQSTNRWVSIFLNNEYLRDKTLNVLVALSVKPLHPFNFKRLDTFLMSQKLIGRDLFWTEYLRHSRYSGTPLRILAWTDHSVSKTPSADFAQAYVTVLKWFLTSTQRGFRDRVTHVLFRIGLAQPAALFGETARALAVDDPYVSERMLAASYGVAMAIWQDRSKPSNRTALLDYAKTIFGLMFKPSAKYGTTHALSRDYAQHTIRLAIMLRPNLLPQGQLKFITRPFRFGGLRRWKRGGDRDKGKYHNGDSPLGMDFANYTLGRLTPNRSPYDDANPDYQTVKKQILWRIYNLGYSLKAFSAIDQEIARDAFRDEQRGTESRKTDRYGKKYAWIAFYELAGYRQDAGLLALDDGRISDADIDPSFPERPKSTLIFPESWIEHEGSVNAWLHCGYRPEVADRLVIESIDGAQGPWVLLDGFVDRASKGKDIFSLFKGLFVPSSERIRLVTLLSEIGHPGNVIERREEEYYTFAGEIPWAETWRPEQYPKSVEAGRTKIPITSPVRNYSWESYHSAENQLGGTSFLTKEVGEELNLYVQIPSIRMAQKGTSRPASITTISGEPYKNSESILFLRQDLLEQYLAKKGLSLIVIVWGERRADYHAPDSREDARKLEGKFEMQDVLHKQGFVYESGSFRKFL